MYVDYGHGAKDYRSILKRHKKKKIGNQITK